MTNYRQGRRESAAPRSRGRLVSDFLTTATDARNHIERVTSEAALYNGFNLLAGDAKELYYFSNREGSARVLAPGVYGLGNHLLDTAWPKVSSSSAPWALSGRAWARAPADLLTLLSDRTRPSDDLLPPTGVGLELERLLSSAFIASADHGTRSSTVLLLDRGGKSDVHRGDVRSGGELRQPGSPPFELDRIGPDSRASPRRCPRCRDSAPVSLPSPSFRPASQSKR